MNQSAGETIAASGFVIRVSRKGLRVDPSPGRSAGRPAVGIDWATVTSVGFGPDGDHPGEALYVYTTGAGRRRVLHRKELSAVDWIRFGIMVEAATGGRLTLELGSPEEPAPAYLRDGSRPANGTLLKRVRRGGRCTLAIVNNGKSDALVSVASDPGRSLAFAVYVWAGETARVTDIGDGSYDVYFATGGGWDHGRRSFTRNRAYARLTRPLTFLAGSNWEITLSPVQHGNADASEVDPRDFPR